MCPHEKTLQSHEETKCPLKATLQDKISKKEVVKGTITGVFFLVGLTFACFFCIVGPDFWLVLFASRLVAAADRRDRTALTPTELAYRSPPFQTYVL